MRTQILAVFFFAILAVSSALTETRDVCIIGGGIGGMGAAAFLKDRGYTSVVLEQAPVTGGSCNTIRFTPPAGHTDDWIDVGVEVFPNTTDANARGLGPWAVDSVAFFARFAGGLDKVIPFPTSGGVSYNVDMKRGISYGTAPPANFGAEWFGALIRLQQILARYPWIDTAQTPETVPPELLVPFSQFIETNQLGPLVPNIISGLLWSGGMGNYDDLTTLYALINLSPTILSIFTGAPAITLTGGCRTLYDGLEPFLGERNVLTNAKVRSVTRNGNVVTVVGKQIDPSGRSYLPFQYTCGKVFIAFPPTYDKVNSMFNLDDRESDYYRKVNIRPYFSVAVEASGPAIDGVSFSMTNMDPQRAYNYPSLPALIFLGRDLGYGPIQGAAVGKRETSVEDITDVIQDQLDNLVSTNLVTNAKVAEVARHEFQPYYTSNALSKIPSPPAVLRGLQGYRNTYIVGAVDSYASHVQILDRTFRLISANFPQQP
jgi:hypothetical protein